MHFKNKILKRLAKKLKLKFKLYLSMAKVNFSLQI